MLQSRKIEHMNIRGALLIKSSITNNELDVITVTPGSSTDKLHWVAFSTDNWVRELVQSKLLAASKS